MKNARPQTSETSAETTAAVYRILEAKVLAGATVRSIDFPTNDRPAFQGAIHTLMDTLPVVMRWQTIDENHLAGTRVRVRTYSIPTELLRGADHG